DALDTAETLKAQFPRLVIEASGGISKDTLSQYFSPHIDIISLGYLTQHYAAVDFSLKIVGETELGNGEAQGATLGPDAAASRRDFAF
ncbi:hypothetical protein chiPu_0028912, partial [Chiloscyllium punctatum]|nr:hypothetical protein [Chiloscyllium punctatum]